MVSTVLADILNSLILEGQKIFCVSISRHKGGQVSPQNTEVTQFVSSDIDVQSDHNTLSSSVAVLQGRQGVPAGKLPPIRPVVRSVFFVLFFFFIYTDPLQTTEETVIHLSLSETHFTT